MEHTTVKQHLKHVSTTAALLAATLHATTGLAAIAPGDLTITEVMANPASVSDTQGEWFEVFNGSGSMLDLDGLVLRDNGSNQHTVNGPLAVAAGDYLVFGRNADTATNGGYSADYEYSSFTLGNSSDEIVLEFDGQIIDALGYDGDAAFGIAGVSAELTGSGFTPSPAGLIYGDGDTGTPGAAGSDPVVAAPSPVPLPGAAWLLASALGGLVGTRRLR